MSLIEELHLKIEKRELTFNGRKFVLCGSVSDGYFASLVPANSDDVLRVASFILRSSDSIFDVGGNIGITSLFFSACAPQGFVYTFEPGRVNYSILSLNVVENHLNNVTTFNCAVGKEDGDLTFYESTAFGAGSFSLADQNIDARATVDASLLSATVPMRSVDSMVAELGLRSLDFIKIDVEGAELTVIEGATNTIERYRPTVVLEVNTVNLLMYQDQPPVGFVKKLMEIFDQVFWIERGTGRLLPIKLPVDIHRFVMFNLSNGFVDNLLCTFESRGISEKSVPAPT